MTHNLEGIEMDLHGNISYPTVPKATALMAELQDLWCAERCGIDLRFETDWCLLLSWTQEYGNLHGADWAEYTWQFYADTPEEALTLGLEWCHGLLPFQACSACDGRGWWSRSVADMEAGIQTQCEDCGGTGLEHLMVERAGYDH